MNRELLYVAGKCRNSSKANGLTAQVSMATKVDGP